MLFSILAKIRDDYFFLYTLNRNVRSPALSLYHCQIWKQSWPVCPLSFSQRLSYYTIKPDDDALHNVYFRSVLISNTPQDKNRIWKVSRTNYELLSKVQLFDTEWAWNPERLGSAGATPFWKWRGTANLLPLPPGVQTNHGQKDFAINDFVSKMKVIIACLRHQEQKYEFVQHSWSPET